MQSYEWKASTRPVNMLLHSATRIFHPYVGLLQKIRSCFHAEYNTCSPTRRARKSLRNPRTCGTVLRVDCIRPTVMRKNKHKGLTLYWGYIGIMENRKEATILEGIYWGYKI